MWCSFYTAKATNLKWGGLLQEYIEFNRTSFGVFELYTALLILTLLPFAVKTYARNVCESSNTDIFRLERREIP